MWKERGKKGRGGEGRKEREGRGKKGKLQLNMVAHTRNPSMWETEAGSTISSSGPAWTTYLKTKSVFSPLFKSIVTFLIWFVPMWFVHIFRHLPIDSYVCSGIIFGYLHTHRMSRLEFLGYQFVHHWNKVTVHSISKVSCEDESFAKQLAECLVHSKCSGG